jgi:hypothetical protein
VTRTTRWSIFRHAAARRASRRIPTRKFIASLIVTAAVAACAESPALPSAPSSPATVSVASPAPPVPGVSVLTDATLSGSVYELVGDSHGQRRGIEGVSVYCEACGESTHNFAYTDSKGEYVFPRGVWTEGRTGFPTRISVSKDGYTDPPGLPRTTPPNPSGPGSREVVIEGDTRFDMELVRR